MRNETSVLTKTDGKDRRRWKTRKRDKGTLACCWLAESDNFQFPTFLLFAQFSYSQTFMIWNCLVDFVLIWGYKCCAMMDLTRDLKSKGAKTTKGFVFSVLITNVSESYTEDLSTLCYFSSFIIYHMWLCLKQTLLSLFFYKKLDGLDIIGSHLGQHWFFLSSLATIISSDFHKKTDNKWKSEIKKMY